jgi:aminoglycoside phosphotransferase (APT) family kinase protein
LGAWLDQSEVAHYLLSLGLVNPRAVVEEDLTVTDASGRNRVFVVTSSRAPTLVVKQAAPATAISLAREAATLRALASVPALRPLVPELVRYEPGTVTLVLRSPAAAAWDRARPAGRLLARALGRALAAVHRARADMPAAEPPWALALPEPPVERLRTLSTGALELLDRIQASERWYDRLSALQAAPRGDCVIHGDLRLANCLTVTPPGGRRRTGVLLIDWEQAGLGDAAVDLGAVLSEYLRLWIASMPIVDEWDPGRFAGRASQPIERLRPAIHACLDGYRAAGEWTVPLRRVIEMAGVRLLETAMAYAQRMERPNAHVVTLANLGGNMLCVPDAAAAGLLGLRA